MDALAGSCLTIVLDADGEEICRLFRPACGQPAIHGSELQRLLLDYDFPVRLKESRTFRQDGSADSAEIAAVARHFIAHFRDGHLVSENCRVAFIYTIHPVVTASNGPQLFLRIDAGNLDGTTERADMRCIFYDSPVESFVAEIEQAEFEAGEARSRIAVEPPLTAKTIVADKGPTAAKFGLGIGSVSELHEHIDRTLYQFKPGELTADEEQMVRQKGLSALNHISQRTIEKQQAALRKYEEPMRTDPDFRMEQEIRSKLRQRFGDFQYGWWMLGILAVCLFISDAYGLPTWPMGLFIYLVMLAVLEISYWVYARRVGSKFGAFVLAAVLLPSGFYSYKLYDRMVSDFRDSESWIAPVSVDDESTSENGYIYDMRTTIDFRSEIQIKKIVWWVNVPNTSKSYTCAWVSGYTRFSKEDSVKVIHKKLSNEEDATFIVGLYGDERDRSAGCQ